MVKVKIEPRALDDIKKGFRAQVKVANYLREHDLDPDKDWENHPIHGEYLKPLIKLIRLGEMKAYMVDYQQRYANREQRRKEYFERYTKPDCNPRVKRIKNVPNIYDYPLVEGKPMSKLMRKKYRRKMRKMLRAHVGEDKAKESAIKFAMQRGGFQLEEAKKREVRILKKINQDKKKIDEEVTGANKENTSTIIKQKKRKYKIIRETKGK